MSCILRPRLPGLVLRSWFRSEDVAKKRGIAQVEAAYRCAVRVLVLGRSLKILNHDLEPEELLTRMFVGRWMNRPWSAQEAYLVQR